MLISNLRSIFSTYGTPKILFSDGGPQFKSKELEQFLGTWCVKHERSSARYPQSNGRAELAVKTAKRILEENTAADGSLNTDRACRALLQYRNTPLQHFGLSPAQILFHRQLRDCIPTSSEHLKPHSSWLIAANDREQAFYQRNQRLISEYNRTAHVLPPLTVGSTVLIHDGTNRRRWNRVGTVVAVNDRNYTLRMHGSGRVVTRNRKFLKLSGPVPDDGMLMQGPAVPTTVSPTPVTVGPSSSTQVSLEHSSPSQDLPAMSSSVTASEHIDNSSSTHDEMPQSTVNDSLSPAKQTRTGIPNLVKRLLPYNKPGLKE